MQTIQINTTVVIADKKPSKKKVDAEIEHQQRVAHYMARVVAHYAKKQK